MWIVGILKLWDIREAFKDDGVVRTRNDDESAKTASSRDSLLMAWALIWLVNNSRSLPNNTSRLI